MGTRLSELLFNSQSGSTAVSAEEFSQTYGDLLRKGLRLAYFIVGDRETAVEIVGGAMSKLKTQHCQEKKRFYWRDKSLKDRIYRFVRGESDMFQWLILLESGSHEKLRERAGSATTRDLVVGYIKHLVQTASAKSAFYVSVGIQRLLYGYNTTEAQSAYERLTEHYAGAEMYRKVKRILMGEMERRFQHLIKSCKGPYGERRFETQEDQRQWVELVDGALKAFIPWSTLVACPLSGTLGFDAGSSHLVDGSRAITQDLRELRRCHVFIDPDCYKCLTDRAGLDSPEERLTIPLFFNADMGNQSDRRGKSGNDVEDLTDAEISRIMARIDEEAALRQKVTPQFLRILADGEERARIGVQGRGDRYECIIPEGASLLEIATEFNGRALTLAKYWIEYMGSGGVAPARATLNLGHGSNLSIEIEPVEETEEKPGGILLRLGYRRGTRFAFRSPFTRPSWRPYGIAGVALTAVLLMAIGWLGASRRWRHEIGKLQGELATEQSARRVAENRASAGLNEHAPYRLLPNDFVRRDGEGTANEVPIAILPGQNLVTLELPVGNGDRAYRAVLKTYFEGKELLSESSISPRKDNRQTVVEFVVPAVVFHDGQIYSVDLYSMNDSGKQEKIHSFTFSTIGK
jgi:hypothetical protein